MGIGVSSCIGRRKKVGKYRVNDPRRARNECLATLSDFGMKDGELCVRYKGLNQPLPRPLEAQAKKVTVAADEVDAVPGDNEKNEAVEEMMTCHNHGPLPAGVDGGTEVPHPDLPKGVTCITCAATIMEKGQEQEMGEKVLLDKDTAKATQETRTVEEDKDAVTANAEDGKLTDQGKDTVKSDPASGDKTARGPRRRRRHNALDKAHPAVVKAE
ncbi:uncharacterized protein LOC119740393 [Patiria miniata]|uniref:Uncharacterized protein n=1 Tax=Patiria miniata TaxID=46514 RepID=A0A914B712_PATMI|nr:uncharacterized protein LOC119740393 [Patiria miniata]